MNTESTERLNRTPVDSLEAPDSYRALAPHALVGLEKTLKLVFPLVILAIIFHTLRFLQYGGLWTFSFQCAILIAGLLVFLFRRSIPPSVRYAMYCSGPLAFGVAGMVHWGPTGQGLVLIALSAIMASVAGLRAWKIAMAIGFSSACLVGAAYMSGFLAIAYDPYDYAHSFIAWGVGLTTLLASACMALLWQPLYRMLEARTRELQNSDHKLHAILDHQYQFTGLLDTSGRLIAINPSALKFGGVTEADVIGLPFWKTHGWRHSPELQEKVRDAVCQAAQGRFSRFQCTNCNAAGELRTIDFSLRPVQDESGAILYLVPEGRDVTELVETQEELRERVADLQSIFQQAAVGIVYTDTRGNIVQVNRRFAELLGATHEDLSGRSYTDFVHPDEIAEVRENFRRLAQGEIESCTFERRFIRGDQSIAWMRITGSAVCDANGRPGRVVLIVQDIGEQKQTQDALDAIVEGTSYAVGEEFFRELVRRLALVLDARSVIVAELAKKEDEEVRTLAVWRDGAPAGNFSCGLEGTPFQTTVEQGVLACEHGLRGLFPNSELCKEFSGESYLGTLLRDASGKPLGLLAVLDDKPLRDIRLGTALLGVFSSRAALEMQRLRAEERSRLQQQQLIYADKMASLGVLVAGVAHEINNPNGYIRLGIDLLDNVLTDMLVLLDDLHDRRQDIRLTGLPYAEARREVLGVLRQMREGTERIAQIVTDLRDFARQEPTTAQAGIDFNAVVAAALRLLTSLIRKSTDHLQVGCAEGLPPISGNSQRLEQIVINLLTNACHALPDKSKCIRVTTRYNEAAGKVVLEVEDEGVGIAPEDLRHITDPFYTTKRDQGGTGLGLSISAGIVANHGGTLEFSSMPGRGTRATLSLPVRKAQQDKPSAE